MSTLYRSDVKVGKRYKDEQTGLEGIVTSLVFFQHGCERACIEVVDGKDIKDYYFDVGRLTATETGKKVMATEPGGGSNPPRRSTKA